MIWWKLAKYAAGPLLVIGLLLLMIPSMLLAGGSGDAAGAALAGATCRTGTSVVTGALDGQKVATLAAAAGFPVGEIPTAVAIARAESGWKADATNLNNNGTTDWGLFQINDVNASVLSQGNKFDPADNAKMAFKIWSSWGNWKAWATFNSGSYRNFLVDVVTDAPGCTPEGVNDDLPLPMVNWSRFTNGQIPARYLRPLWANPDRRLRPDAAVAFDRLSKAYFATYGTKTCVTDAYRSRAEQDRIWITKPGLAARPGTSNHGWGQAVDLGCGLNVAGSSQDRWMHANAGRFGWKHPAWAEPNGSKPEPWHWEYGVR